MERVIAIANQKGGVGKSTTVINLAAGLAKLGKRVMVIDLDAQGALTVSLGYDPYTIQPSTYNLLLNDRLAFAELLKWAGHNLQLAPANTELVAAEYRLIKLNARTHRLKQALERRNGNDQQFDFVLIDTPPSLNLLTVNGLVAADELLIPVAANYLSMRGVRALLESVTLIRKRINPELKLLGVLPTLVQPNAPHSMSAISEIRAVFKNKVFDTFIPSDETAAIAPAVRKSVLDYRPDSAVAKAYRQLAKEVSDE